MPTPPVPETNVPIDLNAQLVALLSGHGVDAAVADDVVILEPDGAEAVLSRLAAVFGSG